MNPDEVLEVIHAHRISAIVRLNDLSRAIDLSRALLAGGIRALEFTLSNPTAIQAMVEVKAALPEFERGEAVIGMGTVLNAGQARSLSCRRRRTWRRLKCAGTCRSP